MVKAANARHTRADAYSTASSAARWIAYRRFNSEPHITGPVTVKVLSAGL